jgi:hypothetical protein
MPLMTPLCLLDIVPAQHDLSAMIHFELAKHGGHVGFIGGTPNKPDYYLCHIKEQEFLSLPLTEGECVLDKTLDTFNNGRDALA